MLKVKNLVYEYPTKRVLHDVSFTIEKGNITVLVGPNGAGKTTLIRCMVGLFEPLAGSVLFNDKEVSANPVAAHKDMGYLPDFFGLYDALTVQECLRYAALAQGVVKEKVEESIKIASERLSLDNRLHEMAGNLSRGLKQRLAIAQAIVHKPSFLVLDEPASGLDPDARTELSKLFKQLRSEGMTLVVSSHILAELEDYATEMIVVKDGRLVGQKMSFEDRQVMRRLIIRLSENDDRIINILSETDNVSSIKYEDLTCSCSFGGDSTSQKDLLKKLISANVPIIEFKEGAERLHDAYLTSMQDDLKAIRQGGFE